MAARKDLGVWVIDPDSLMPLIFEGIELSLAIHLYPDRSPRSIHLHRKEDNITTCYCVWVVGTISVGWISEWKESDVKEVVHARHPISFRPMSAEDRDQMQRWITRVLSFHKTAFDAAFKQTVIKPARDRIQFIVINE